MNKIKLMLLLLVIFFAFNANAAKFVNGIAAVVNEDIITQKEVSDALKPYVFKIERMYKDKSKKAEALESIREKILEDLINKKLINQRALLFGVKVDEKEIDNAIANIKKINSLDDATFIEDLKKEGLDLEKFRQNIKEDIIRSKIMHFRVKSKIVITEEDIKNYYDNNQEKFGKTKEYHLRNIMVEFSNFASEIEKGKAVGKMAQVQQKLKLGLPFDRIARKFSEASNAQNGGELGFVALADLAKEIRNNLKKINVEEYTNIIETKNSYQIFYIEEIKQNKPTPLKKVKDEIAKLLYKNALQNRFQDWIKDLRESAYIKKN